MPPRARRPPPVRFLVGTSGWDYAPWVGRFYPREVRKARRLAYYAERFPSVEVNSTFYKLPAEDVIRGWAEQAPPGFLFAVKAWQMVTHMKRLLGADDFAREFCERAALLGDKLGPLLFGLPPNMKKDLPRLQAFLDGLNAKSVAFEFRHPSWFDDDVFRALEEHGAALCIAESEELATPMVRTAPVGYLRLRRDKYSPKQLRAGADRIRAAGFSSDVHVYFKHEDTAKGVGFAKALRKLLA
jgi:uncharacterized protein YecE (DUF72 family)